VVLAPTLDGEPTTDVIDGEPAADVIDGEPTADVIDGSNGSRGEGVSEQGASQKSRLVTIPTKASSTVTAQLDDGTSLWRSLFPQSKLEQLRVTIYADLWDRGFYITTGHTFGGQYLAYPGMSACTCTTPCRSSIGIASVGLTEVNVARCNR
jgi:hypothetical protein